MKCKRSGAYFLVILFRSFQFTKNFVRIESLLLCDDASDRFFKFNLVTSEILELTLKVSKFEGFLRRTNLRDFFLKILELAVHFTKTMKLALPFSSAQ